MCDPVSLAVGAVAGTVATKALTPKPSRAATAAPPDPAVERATAEAEAQQRANAQLAADQRRRREQQNLLARGAPQQPTMTFGEAGLPTNGIGPTSGMTTRSTTARQASLMGRGAPGATFTGGGGASTRRTTSSVL